MHKIDGLKTKPKIRVVKQRPQESPTYIVPKRYKIFNIFGYVDTKQLLTVAITFVITLTLSLATSQSLAKLNSNEQPEPVTKSSLIVSNNPEEGILEGVVLIHPGEIFLPKENIIAPDPLQKRKEFLEQYLKARNSPLANHVDELAEQTQWKLIIGIARAESSFCKRYKVNNCWGIGGAWNMRKYKNLDEGIADTNRLLEQHYVGIGLDSPKKIVRKWVGHFSENWQAAVEQELENLKNVD